MFIIGSIICGVLSIFRYRIEALTITGKPGKRHKLQAVGELVESVFRSINNLLEALHQSFFFYILPSTDRYISIGVYMPPFALIAVASLIQISFSLSPVAPTL